MRFDLLDVFTDRPFTGNALAVVRAALEPETAAMQAVAREFNLSETVFLVPPVERGDVRLRIFTPAEELPFAGHPTLGAAAVVAWDRGGGRAGAQDLRLEERVGTIPVTVEVRDERRAFARLTAPLPELGAVAADPGLVASALSLAAEDLAGPPQVASSGVPFLFVHLRGLDAVRRARLRPDRWEPLAKTVPAHGLVPFCLASEQPGAAVHGRMFSPTLGIVEDPATGAAAGPLGALLVARGLVPVQGGRAAFVFEQGYEMGRPSRLHVELTVVGGAVAQARVGGEVVRVARGELEARP